MFEGRKPEIGEITFVGCSVGEQPDELVGFAKFFKACKISAWTKFWVTQVMKGDGEWFRKNKNKMDKYKDYFLTGANYSDLEKSGTQTLMLEWFQDDIEAKALVTKQQIDGSSTPDRKIFKPRSAGKTRSIAGDKAAKLREEYDKTPVTPFEFVVVTTC